jgi:hypothetical protein
VLSCAHAPTPEMTDKTNTAVTFSPERDQSPHVNAREIGAAAAPAQLAFEEAAMAAQVHG